VSVFAKYGRKFVDAAVDGSLNAVRRIGRECINSLGEGTHPQGSAYNATTAKESGVDQFLVVGGTEDTEFAAPRPSLLEDAVLICDVRLVSGQTTIALTDIALDRRQTMVPNELRHTASALDASTGTDLLHAVDKYATVTGSPLELTFSVSDGRGFVDDGNAGTFGLSFGQKSYRRYDFSSNYNGSLTIPAATPESSLHRRDAIAVDFNGAVRVIKGTPHTWPANVPPPSIPTGWAPLMEVLALPGTTDTSTWPMVRRGFRRAPFPFTELTGVLQGCKLNWLWPGLAVTPSLYVSSDVNKILFNGELVEFNNHGMDAALPSLPRFPVSQDPLHSPFAAAAGLQHNPYYIYACRKQFRVTASLEGTVPSEATNVDIIESLAFHNPNTGHPQGPLSGQHGPIAPEDAILIGVGWVQAGTTNRVAVTLGPGDWFSPNNWTNTFGSLMPGLTILSNTQATYYMPSAPIGCTAVRCMIEEPGDTRGVNYLNIFEANHSTAFVRRLIVRNNGSNLTDGFYTCTEVELPLNSSQQLTFSAVGDGNWTVRPVAFQVPIRRVAGNGLF
jgi:hypothetical protein